MKLTPERIEHMTVQYVWGLENDQDFMRKAKHEVERANFASFRRLVGVHIQPTRKMIGEEAAYAISGPEWSFLYLEMWFRLGGRPNSFDNSNDRLEYRYQLDRLERAGFTISPRGVVRMPTLTNPCAEVSIGESQPCTLQEPETENTMSLITITHTTFVNNTPVDKLSDNQLIDLIKKAEEDVAELKKIKAKSEKIKAKIAELEAGIASIVELLDKRA